VPIHGEGFGGFPGFGGEADFEGRPGFERAEEEAILDLPTRLPAPPVAIVEPIRLAPPVVAPPSVGELTIRREFDFSDALAPGISIPGITDVRGAPTIVLPPTRRVEVPSAAPPCPPGFVRR